MSNLFHFLCVVYISFVVTVSGLGINCRGSGLCPLASFSNTSPTNIIQTLRNILYLADANGNRTYSSGEHIICVGSSVGISLGAGALAGNGKMFATTTLTLSGRVGHGGICLFPQSGVKDFSISLSKIRPLVDALVDHACATCGSVPVGLVDKGSNDPGPGILTFNYVGNPSCTGKCISSLGTSGVTVNNGQGFASNKGTPETVGDVAAVQVPSQSPGAIQPCSPSAATNCSSPSQTVISLVASNVPLSSLVQPPVSIQTIYAFANSANSSPTTTPGSSLPSTTADPSPISSAAPTSTGHVRIDFGNGTIIDLNDQTLAQDAVHQTATSPTRDPNAFSCTFCVVNQRTSTAVRRMLRRFRTNTKLTDN